MGLNVEHYDPIEGHSLVDFQFINTAVQRASTFDRSGPKSQLQGHRSVFWQITMS